MMCHRLIWTNFAYYILAIRLFLSLSMNLTSRLLTLLTSDNYRYQTHRRNITEFYMFIPKYLLPKLQVCILNLSTTFWYCRKHSDYFWTMVYIILFLVNWSVLFCFIQSLISGPNFWLRLFDAKPLAELMILTDVYASSGLNWLQSTYIE